MTRSDLAHRVLDIARHQHPADPIAVGVETAVGVLDRQAVTLPDGTLLLASRIVDVMPANATVFERGVAMGVALTLAAASQAEPAKAA